MLGLKEKMKLLERHYLEFCSLFPGVKTLNNLISPIYSLGDVASHEKKTLHWIEIIIFLTLTINIKMTVCAGEILITKLA